MSSSTTFKWNTVWVNELDRRIRVGLYEMADDVAGIAFEKAPYDHGDLSASIMPLYPDNFTAIVHAGGARVPYARRREFENNKNPHTKYYMKRSLDEVVNDSGYIQKYFGNIAK